MTTVIRNQGTSLAVREKLAADGRPVLLAFSCGKDSIAAWLAMRDMGIEVVPAYLYYVPGLRFVDEELDYFEQKFQTRIKRYPHPSLYRWLNNAVFQAPERLRYIEAARLPEPSYEQMWDFIRADVGLDKSTWCADGVRAADSIQRRGAFVQYGYWRRNLKKVSPIGDWLKGEVLDCIRGHHIELPCDYAWFGRSFDGIDALDWRKDKRNEDLKATLIACAGHPRLATFADAGFYMHVVDGIARKVDAALDPPEQRREIGTCELCETMLTAGAADQWVTCPVCGREQRAQTVKLRRLKTLCWDDSRRGSAAEIAKVFTDAGITVKRHTLTVWKSRGKLDVTPQGISYSSVYRLVISGGLDKELTVTA